MTYDDFLEAFPDAKVPDEMGKGATALMLRPGVSCVVFHDPDGLDVTGARLMVRVGGNRNRYVQFAATLHEVFQELTGCDHGVATRLLRETGILDFQGTFSPTILDDEWKVSPLLTGDIFSVDVMRV